MMHLSPALHGVLCVALLVVLVHTGEINLGSIPNTQCTGVANQLKQALFPAGYCAKNIILPTNKRTNVPDASTVFTGAYGHFVVCRTEDQDGNAAYVFNAVSNDEDTFQVDLACPRNGQLARFSLPFAKSYVINGTVATSSSETIGGAVVTVGNVSTTTGEYGFYTLSVKKGTYSVSVAAGGFEEHSSKLIVAGDTSLDFVLEPSRQLAVAVSVSYLPFNDTWLVSEIPDMVVARYIVKDNCDFLLNEETPDCACLGQIYNLYSGNFFLSAAYDATGCDAPSVLSVRLIPRSYSSAFGDFAGTVNVAFATFYEGEENPIEYSLQKNTTDIGEGVWQIFSLDTIGNIVVRDRIVTEPDEDL